MNNIPEKDNLPLEEESTVFSAPTTNDKDKKKLNKSKKRLPIAIISICLVAALIGGTVAVIKLIPEKTDDTTSTPAVSDIEVLKLSSDNFKTVSVKNSNGLFKLYSKTEKNESDETSSVSWFMDGYKEGLLSSQSIQSVADAVSTISASREITTKSATACGLDKPIIKADVTDNKDNQFSVLIGNESPDKSGYYLKLSNKEKIYVVDSSVKESLDFTPVSLANTDIIPAFDTQSVSSEYKSEDGTLFLCDKLTLTGKNFSKPLVLEKYDDEVLAQYVSFKITSPSNRIADNTEDIITAFSGGISVIGAYSLDVNPSTIKALGLDNPDLTAKMEIAGKSLTYKFKLQPDGNYAAIYDGAELVKQVLPDSIPFIKHQTSDYYADFVCFNNINDLEGFTFKSGDTTHFFSIKANPDEDAEDSYIINYNGKTLKSLPFQDFYEKCILLSCSDYTIDNVKGDAEYSIIFHFKDEIGNDQKIEFIKYSATKYQYFVDGEAMGKISVSSLKSLENNLNDMLKNQKAK
ncbi:MAG: DUF4340 domain-containing protein [Clostridia bacterium]|nr:DUF4340 domain-containing protein [Clostridia bacterium]